MKVNPFTQVAALLALSIASASVQASPANIPTILSGTYQLTFASSSSTMPFEDDSVHTLVINGADDSLCVDGELYLDPYYLTANSNEPLWAGQSNVYFGLSTLANDSFNEIQVYSGSETNFVGQFTGSRISESTACAGSGGLSLSAQAESLFDLAAELYPDIFSNGSALGEAQGYIYRFFEDSGVYVGIKDETVSLLGGPFGSSIVSKGSIGEVLALLQGLKEDVQQEPSADALTLFDLAAVEFPNLFAGGSELRSSVDGFLYRFYEDGGIFAGIKNGSVYLKGGAYGTVFTNIGTLNAILNQLEGINGGEIYDIPEGEFTLTVTGTVSIMGMSSGLNFVIDDVPAPDLNDQSAIEDAFVASLEDVEGIVINDFDYDVIDSSADHVEFAMTVDATVDGVSFVYTLNYDYVR